MSDEGSEGGCPHDNPEEEKGEKRGGEVEKDGASLDRPQDEAPARPPTRPWPTPAGRRYAAVPMAGKSPAKRPAAERAVRAGVTGKVRAVGFRDATVERAGGLGALGWVRHDPAGEGLLVHAEGTGDAVDGLLGFLARGPADAGVDAVEVENVKPEGHEQFAIRGVPAGVFVVQEHHATAHHFDLRLEVDGVMRSWAVPKGPSMDPSVKRMAIQVPDHELSHNDFEGELGEGSVIVWDNGTYEQGGRVAWPEALDRGHAVFVLHGHKLEGGFALQRTRRGDKPQWLLIKRADEWARRGSDVVAEHPGSVLSGD